MPTIYGAVDLVKNELRNAVIQNLGSAPASPVKGQIYYDSAGNVLYWYNGTGWVAAQGGAGAVPATTVTTQAIGDAPVVGTATTYAREDHKHGQPAFGAVTAEGTFGSASGNGVAATLPRSDHTHGNPTHDAAAHAAIPLSALAPATSFIDMGSHQINNVTDPAAAQDAATKNYVDNLVNGLAWKDTVWVATTANITLSGTQTVDGQALVQGHRVLVKNQTLPAENGIYRVNTVAWTRTNDADLGTEMEACAVYVDAGTTNGETAWVCTTNAPITIGTTGLTFVQFAGPGAVTAGTGMTQAGNVLNVITGDTSLVVNADELHVNTAVIATVASVAAKPTKYAAALTGTASPETVTHNLNTRDIQLTVLNGSTPYTAAEVDWDATTVNTAVIRYNPNLGAGYRVVVTG